MFKGGEAETVPANSNTGAGELPHPISPPGGQPGAGKTAPTKASRGKVAHVDAALGFVVIDFTFSALPPAGLRFGVFRNGLRVGEITTTKMVDEAFQVADINKGDIRMGDDVRLD
ncbi:MAG: hypothetical protein CMM26_13485 [Rhodospirillaceae bacterium]|nr:hypothetical protein [Rhodospirillaceae bacterium]